MTLLYESLNTPYLEHHGVKGQKWGVRRFQNEDGSLTAAGRKRYEKAYAKFNTLGHNDPALRRAITNAVDDYWDDNAPLASSKRALIDDMASNRSKYKGTHIEQAAFRHYMEYRDSVKSDRMRESNNARIENRHEKAINRVNRKSTIRHIGNIGVTAVAATAAYSLGFKNTSLLIATVGTEKVAKIMYQQRKDTINEDTRYEMERARNR